MFSFLGVILFIFVLILGTLYYSLLKVRVHHPASYKGGALDDLPIKVKTALASAIGDLRIFGFEGKFALQAPAEFETSEDAWSIIMLRPDRKVVAVVTAKTVNGKQTVKAELFSRLESGELVLTGNAAEFDIAGVPSGIIAEFKGYPSAQEQLDAHATQLATIGQLAQVLDEKEAMFEYLKMNLQELEFLEEKKMIVEIAGTEPRQYRLRRAALPFLSLKTLFISFTALKKFSKSWSNPTIRSRGGLTEDITHQAKDVRWVLDEQTLIDLSEYQSQKSKKGKSSGFVGALSYVCLVLG